MSAMSVQFLESVNGFELLVDDDEADQIATDSNFNSEKETLDDYQSSSAATRLVKARTRRSNISAAITSYDDRSGRSNLHVADKEKRRRRSSARFLRLSPDECDENDSRLINSSELGEMYNHVIRMHAENKINSNNSWGLKLIENLDKLLADDSIGVSEHTSSRPIQKQDLADRSGFNFMKASCTLDASTKIYSYRVDDVHLTSYRVLANLNRSDNSAKKAPDSELGALQITNKKQLENKAGVETLDAKFTNINMSKLESAYDVDPLFYKMSKKFDEGGAKGLLLANLCVSSYGCDIVFDSKEQAAALPFCSPKFETTHSIKQPLESSAIDITCLKQKMQASIKNTSFFDDSFVPQLNTLRETFDVLEACGFVEESSTISRSHRYETPIEEEKEAQKSIHHDALERSRITIANVNESCKEEDIYDSINYDVETFIEYNDDDVINGFDNFLAIDDITTSHASSQILANMTDMKAKNQVPSVVAANNFLDLISTGNHILEGGIYNYFNPEVLEKMNSQNFWAGAQHWKRFSNQISKTVATNEDSRLNGDLQSRTPGKLKSRAQYCIDLTKTDYQGTYLVTNMTKRSKIDPLQHSNITKKKNSKNDNCLPKDSQIGPDHLMRFFCRPTAVPLLIANQGTLEKNSARKIVGFADYMADSKYFHDEDGNSDVDGHGFSFNEQYEDTDYLALKRLTGVRMVEKSSVRYATVPKKVDVKKLKNDLWKEVQYRLTSSYKDEEVVTDQELSNDSKNISDNSLEDKTKLSFKDMVQFMDENQGQDDVTISFYFICLLHLANEKGLILENKGTNLEDFAVLKEDIVKTNRDYDES